MNEFPFVSIVVPTRNRVLRLEGCVSSLVSQDYPLDRYEVIVVDDGSTDETGLWAKAAIVRTLKPSMQYALSGGHGANAARNAGIRLSRGDLVCFVDDDVLAPPVWLRHLVAAALNQGVEVVWGPVTLPPELRLPGRHRIELAGHLSEAQEPQIPLLCNMLVRKEVFARGEFGVRWKAPVEEMEWLMRTNPSRSFTSDAWLCHHKSTTDCSALNLLRLAWTRGVESGRFDRIRIDGPLSPPMRCAIGAFRALGHAVTARCLGGLVIATGWWGHMLGYVLAAGWRNDS